MSIWSECSGTVVMTIDSHFSVAKAWKDLHDELICKADVEHKDGKAITTFRVAMSLDGLSAANVVDQFVSTMSENKGYVYSQIEANIRFT